MTATDPLDSRVREMMERELPCYFAGVGGCSGSKRRVCTNCGRRPELTAAVLELVRAETVRQLSKQSESFERTRPLCPDHRDKQAGECIVCKLDAAWEAKWDKHCERHEPTTKSLATARRRDALIEAAKAVCANCRDEQPPLTNGWHRWAASEAGIPCLAAAIHGLLAKEPK